MKAELVEIWGEKSQKSKETIIVELKLGDSAVVKVVCLSHYEESFYRGGLQDGSSNLYLARS